MNLTAETEKKDAALNLLDNTRGDLITEAKAIAREIAQRDGTVTSPAVLAVLKERKGTDLASVDPRFMGVVFRDGWVKTGSYVNNGSHRRPVAVWKLA